jgi:hypothetical protein
MHSRFRLWQTLKKFRVTDGRFRAGLPGNFLRQVLIHSLSRVPGFLTTTEETVASIWASAIWQARSILRAIRGRDKQDLILPPMPVPKGNRPSSKMGRRASAEAKGTEHDMPGKVTSPAESLAVWPVTGLLKIVPLESRFRRSLRAIVGPGWMSRPHSLAWIQVVCGAAGTCQQPPASSGISLISNSYAVVEW